MAIGPLSSEGERGEETDRTSSTGSGRAADLPFDQDEAGKLQRLVEQARARAEQSVREERLAKGTAHDSLKNVGSFGVRIQVAGGLPRVS